MPEEPFDVSSLVGGRRIATKKDLDAFLDAFPFVKDPLLDLIAPTPYPLPKGVRLSIDALYEPSRGPSAVSISNITVQKA